MTANSKPEHISQEDWSSVEVPEFTDEELARLRPAAEVLPEVVAAYEAGELKRRGRPRKANPKLQVSIRYSPEVIAHFKAKGRGSDAHGRGAEGVDCGVWGVRSVTPQPSAARRRRSCG